MSTSPSTVNAQSRTLATADSWGETWESDDIAFVVAFTDIERDEDIAIALGRSLYAVASITKRIRAMGVDAFVRADNERRRIEARRVETGWDFVTTFPPGWNE